MVVETVVKPEIKKNSIIITHDKHPLYLHNFWIKRNGRCPYCHNGSRPVQKTVIIESLKVRNMFIGVDED